MTRDTHCHCHRGEITRHVGHSLTVWTRVATRSVPVSLSRSRDCCYSGHRSRSRVTSHRSLRDHTSRSRRLRSPREERSLWPPPLHASLLLLLSHFAPNNVAKLSSDPDPDRPQLPGPGNHLGLSGITCIILATVAP